MDSIRLGWNKQSPDTVQFTRKTRYFKKHAVQDVLDQEAKPPKKTVRFKYQTPNGQQQAFENAEYKDSEPKRSQRSIFEDHQLNSSSAQLFTTELTEVNGEQICSVRALITTFIIVVFIIVATAVAIGVVFGTVKSQQNALKTTTVNNNGNLTSTMSTTAIVSSISIGSQTGQPCLSYTTINDLTRNIAQSLVCGTCDIGPLFNGSNGGSWIRFVGTGGTTLPLAPPGAHQCGGYSSGWYNGTLPGTPGTVVNGTVCFEIEKIPCHHTANVAVVNCTNFLVYFLPSVTACNARYCTT